MFIGDGARAHSGHTQSMNADLAPGLLLASPALGDPNFSRSVVLLAQHDEEGALGWVLNGRALGPAGELLRKAGLVPSGARLPKGGSYGSPARVGGPVMPGSAWLLYGRAPGQASWEGEHDLGGAFAVTASKLAIDAVARGEGPDRFRVLLGYAGWGPGQIETEIQSGAWLPAALDGDLLFRLDASELWEAAYQSSVGAMPASFSASRGSA